MKAALPRATIRLQFHPGFTLDDAAARVDEFAALGITHLYASPLSEACENSTHGYDVVDYGRVREALGGMAALERLVAALRRYDMGLLLDIVPNHMAVDARNAWWWDVLCNGRNSLYARHFDIDWDDAPLHGRILLPALGNPYGAVLCAGELALAFDPERETLLVRYFESIFPIRSEHQAALLSSCDADAIASVLRDHDGRTEAGRQRLHELLERQHYRLAHWRAANDALNWRRFFDINELIGFRANDPRAFRDSHASIDMLWRRGLIDGVRVDHVDGIADPRAYLVTLRDLLQAGAADRPDDLSREPYVVVEKILTAGESLPEDWPVHGTTGYEFMDLVGAVLHDGRGAEPLARHWRDATGDTLDDRSHVLSARRQIAEEHFGGEVERCVASLLELAQSSLATRDLTRRQLRVAFIAVLAHFGAYRDYARVDTIAPSNPQLVREAVETARRTLAARERTGLDFVASALLGEFEGAEAAELLRRFRQLTPPLAAKAIEDTTFYRYAPLLSRNEVGTEPSRFAIGTEQFHAANRVRLERCPHSLLATATHDHKRGEDARMRLAVLSERHDAWVAATNEWRAMLGTAEIHPADLDMLLQTIVGAWPLDENLDEPGARRAFVERVAAWQRKALREGKLRSHWTEPDTRYEARARNALDAIFDSRPLRTSLAAFVDSIAPAGAVLSLAQVALRCLSPGVPDLYQGTDGWDFSLVDPDNRRAVDFDLRARWVEENSPPLIALRTWRDGRVKQAVLRRLLSLRNCASLDGYTPLATHGAMATHVIAFARGDVIVVVPRLVSSFVSGEPSVAAVPWADTTVAVESGEWRDVLTERAHRIGKTAAASLLFGEFPMAVLRRA